MYAENSGDESSGSSTDESCRTDDSGGDDDEEDSMLPLEIVLLLKDSTRSPIHDRIDLGSLVDENETAPPAPPDVPPRKRKRKRSRKRRELPPPPFQPTDLQSLIQLAQRCSGRQLFRDCESLGRLLGPLRELEDMVGLASLKQAIVDYVIIHSQSDMLDLPAMRHMIIAGPPGCGKTTVSTIVAKVLAALEGAPESKVVFGTQANMIGGFLGQTAPKTEALIRSAFGGVLVIDEASSLADGRAEQNSDSFSKSCIDTLNRMLSEHGDKFICILAGYKTEIYRDILSINPGMDRRFATRFEIEPYSPPEILEILRRQLKKRGAALADGAEIPLDWVRTHAPQLKHAGGDCMLIANRIMMAHARSAFGQLQKNVLTQADIGAGLQDFVKNVLGDRQLPSNEPPAHMYY